MLAASGAWTSAGQEGCQARREVSKHEDVVLKRGAVCTKNKRRTLVFNVGNGQYVMKVAGKRPNGGKELGGGAGGLHALCKALTYPFSALQQSMTSFYDALK